MLSIINKDLKSLFFFSEENIGTCLNYVYFLFKADIWYITLNEAWMCTEITFNRLIH